MSINFDAARWKTISNIYNKWWRGELERPIINLTVNYREHNNINSIDIIHPVSTWLYGMDTPVDIIIKHWDYWLSNKEFVLDSFPMVLPDYGASVNAAFCGCGVDIRPDTVWYIPEKQWDITRLKMIQNPESPMYKRIIDIYKMAADYFNGSVLLGMTSIEKGIDNVCRFIDSVDMGLALYDHPGDVKRLMWENYGLALFYIEEIKRIIGPCNPGNSCWGNMYSSEPFSGAQCDFSAMISPEHFKEFILPYLSAVFKQYPHSNFYHLDGEGALCHLDMILDIQELKCVQWVPGDGALHPRDWPDVYKKIANAQKNIWYIGDLEDLPLIADMLGTAKGLYWFGECDASQVEKKLRIAEQLGVC